MSYQRAPYPLTYFKTGQTQYYVYSSGNCMQDCSEVYDDNKAYVELLIDIMKREVPDKHYMIKMLHTLSRKLNIEDELKSDKELLEIFEYRLK